MLIAESSLLHFFPTTTTLEAFFLQHFFCCTQHMQNERQAHKPTSPRSSQGVLSGGLIIAQKQTGSSPERGRQHPGAPHRGERKAINTRMGKGRSQAQKMRSSVRAQRAFKMRLGFRFHVGAREKPQRAVIVQSLTDAPLSKLRNQTA